MRERCPGCRCLTSSAPDYCPECKQEQARKTIPPSIKKAITRFDKAARDYEIRGMHSEFPDTYAAIEQEYARARTCLEELIGKHLREKS